MFSDAGKPSRFGRATSNKSTGAPQQAPYTWFPRQEREYWAYQQELRKARQDERVSVNLESRAQARKGF